MSSTKSAIARVNPSVRKPSKQAARGEATPSTPASKASPRQSAGQSAAKPLSARSMVRRGADAGAIAELAPVAAAKRSPSKAASPAAKSPRARSATAAAAATVDVLPVNVAQESPAAKSPSRAKQQAAAAPRSVAKASASAAAATRAAKAPAQPLPLSQRPIDQIWREYRVTPTEEVRNFLVGRHLDLVAYAAERLHKRLPSEVEINDLKSAGAFGLMDAVESFDPDRGVKFETYCTQRIRGAMFDELRSMDWVPRLVRSRTAKVEKVRKSIEMETGARPTEDEVAARLNVSGDEFEKLQKDSRPISMVSLTRKCFETDSSKDVREIDVVEDGRQENPLQAVQKQDLQALITKGLSRAERLIVILYYYEEMTMKEIGATLDLSESRVSQMHSSILARLKAQMQHRETVEE